MSAPTTETTPERDVHDLSQLIKHEPATVPPTPKQHGSETPTRSKKKMWWILVVGLCALALIAVVLFQSMDRQQALPAGFPGQAQLPLVRGEIIPVQMPSVTGEQSATSVQVDSEAAQQEAIELLTDNGYREIGRSGSGPIGTVVSLVSDQYSVRVELSMTGEGAHLVHYTTAPRTDAQSAP